MLILTTGTALASSLSAPDQYDATAKLLLRDSEPIDALLGRTSDGGSDDPERETNTQVALIKLETVAERVADELGLDVPSGQLLGQVSTEVEGTSDIVAITVRDRNPGQAAQLATAFAEEYVAFRKESARASIDETAKLARSRLDSLTLEEKGSQEGLQLAAGLRELEIAASLQTGGAEVVRRAAIPTSRATPRPLLSGLLGFFLGLLLALMVALILEFADRRLKDEEDAQAFFQLPVLATIPRPNRGSGKVILDGNHDMEEGYGSLAASLVFLKRDRRPGALMITSPQAGDGKTSVTLGLAWALSMFGQRVIVVEADLHHPRFVHMFGLEQSGGLASLLAETGKLEDELVVLPDPPRRNWDPGYYNDRRGSLCVLPAGPVPDPSGMLTRPAIASVLDGCRNLADVVLIDTAPVGLVHNPLALVNQVDGVIVVSRLRWTMRDAAHRTVRLLQQVSAPVMGVVLTGGERIQGYYGDADHRRYGRRQPTSRLTRKPKPSTETASEDS